MGKLEDDLNEIENMDLKPMKKSPVERGVIKPCPFCGEQGKLIDRDNGEYDIGCGTGGCYLQLGADWWDGKEEIIQLWNRRAS